MDRIIKIKTYAETIALGKKLGDLLKPGMVICLNGNLGAGKTTFTKGIGQSLGIKRVINSPTFTILKQYQGRYQLNHIDAYRLENQDSDLGLDEIINGDGITVIEWSKYVADLIPLAFLEVEIKRLGDTEREFKFTSHGQDYEAILKELG